MTLPAWKNATDFLTLQVAAVQGFLGRIIDTSVGSLTRAYGQATSGTALWLQNGVITALLLTRASTSYGPDLDSFFAQFGNQFARIGAVASSGDVTYARASPDVAVLIPIGYVDTTGPGGLQFQVIADATNPAYSEALGGYQLPAGVTSINVLVQCLTAGIAGNVIAGAINSYLSPLTGVDTVSNTLAFNNGRLSETDEAALARFQLYINNLSLGTIGAIESAALSVQTLIKIQVEVNTNAAGNFQPGNFVVWVDDGSGDPPAALLAAVSAAVDLVRGLTITYSVAAVQPVNASISFTMAINPGYSFATVSTLVATAIDNYIEALPMGAVLAYTRIPQIAYDASPGVANIIGLVVNGGTADIGGTIGTGVELTAAPTISPVA